MSTPTKPGWYWYRQDEGHNFVSAEVFIGGEYHGGKLIANVPDYYNYLPAVADIKGEWSDEPIKPPSWELNEYSNGFNGQNPRGEQNQ